MTCKHCEITTFIKGNSDDLLFVTETWLSVQGDKAKTVELAPSGFTRNYSHVNRDQVAVELLQYTNLL